MRILLLLVLIAPSSLPADDAKSPPKEFISDKGRFSILFPSLPKEEKVPDDSGGLLQIQFTVGSEDGALLVSYQDNPKLAGAARDELNKALLTAQEKVQKSMQGKLLHSKEITLDKLYPGRDYEFEIPTASGQYRSRSYLVKGRLYQIIVVGKKEFVTSKDAERFMDSFKLLK
jgi:hypothetical protein